MHQSEIDKVRSWPIGTVIELTWDMDIQPAFIDIFVRVSETEIAIIETDDPADGWIKQEERFLFDYIFNEDTLIVDVVSHGMYDGDLDRLRKLPFRD